MRASMWMLRLILRLSYNPYITEMFESAEDLLHVCKRAEKKNVSDFIASCKPLATCNMTAFCYNLTSSIVYIL